MIRGLYTAATGMSAQQDNIDVTANNISNVNTAGFKSDRAEFQDLMYQTLNYTSGATTENTNNPTGVDVGLGVRLSNIQKNFTQGTLIDGSTYDIAIQGNGFFQITMPNGEIGYSRNGQFKLDDEGYIVNGNGYRLEPEIVIDTTQLTNISVGTDGLVTGLNSTTGQTEELGNITIVDFANPAGLNPLGDSIYQATDTSGDALEGTPGEDALGTLLQNYYEGSNVELVKEMVNLITAQRAYEANSKSITTTDSMLDTVNRLKT